MEVVDWCHRAEGLLIPRYQQRSIGRLPQPGHLIPIDRGIGLMDQHVETDGEIGPDGEVCEAANEVFAFGPADLGPANRFGRQVDPDIARHWQIACGLAVATADLDDRGRGNGGEDAGQSSPPTRR